MTSAGTREGRCWSGRLGKEVAKQYVVPLDRFNGIRHSGVRKEQEMGKPAIMIFGLGELGGYVLEFLARTPNMAKIVTVDVREDWGLRKTNSAIIGAAQANFYPDIEFRQGDIFDVE